jgi:hypothetical protein
MFASTNGVIFLECDIFDPMQSIFNLPMPPSGVESVGGRPIPATEIIDLALWERDLG